ncbi:uncharacterized protein LACBIDRAFT_327831 [Laccaria bicolor S238N-H82]|uniref:Predicted protein n=1 Tax=Laccaria bicolor (strain S238N-H82 / ATCC MYA-4686) TaxID=486041 RepID=B0DCZ1_LACBS|nr:uncharacterized protein LACBIDRAFT_327831 [Laccaria bicolor S238N-H82]EDR07383.1 predicted protein [Laccaria bicolor S238N-H82]|eukprot:XP_001881775.1 predicted protein [Laccaria bicolor S238N-H82]
MSMSTSKNVDAYIHILPALEHVRPPPSPIILKQAESVFIWCYIGRALEKKNGQKTQNPSSLAPSTALDRYMSGTPRNCSSETNLWEDLRLFGEMTYSISSTLASVKLRQPPGIRAFDAPPGFTVVPKLIVQTLASERTMSFTTSNDELALRSKRRMEHPRGTPVFTQYTKHFQNNKKICSIKRLSGCALAAAAGAGAATHGINVSKPVNAENLGLWTYSWAQPQEEWSPQAALARAEVFYESWLEGKLGVSQRETYGDHDDGWFEFSWVLGSEEPEVKSSRYGYCIFFDHQYLRQSHPAQR